MGGGVPNCQLESLLSSLWKHLTFGQLSPQSMSDSEDEKQIFLERKLTVRTATLHHSPSLVSGCCWLRENWHRISVTVWDYISLSTRKCLNLTGVVSWTLLDLFSEHHFLFCKASCFWWMGNTIMAHGLPTLLFLSLGSFLVGDNFVWTTWCYAESVIPGMINKSGTWPAGKENANAE